MLISDPSEFSAVNQWKRRSPLCEPVHVTTIREMCDVGRWITLLTTFHVLKQTQQGNGNVVLWMRFLIMSDCHCLCYWEITGTENFTENDFRNQVSQVFSYSVDISSSVSPQVGLSLKGSTNFN